MPQPSKSLKTAVAASKAGSGFAAARQQLNATAKASAGAATTKRRATYDDDLALYGVLIADPLPSGAHPSPTVAVEMEGFDQLERDSELPTVAPMILSQLFSSCRSIRAALLHADSVTQMVTNYDEGALCILGVDVLADADGQPDTPCVCLLGSPAAIQNEIGATDARSVAAIVGPVVVDLPGGDGRISGVRSELPHASWLSSETLGGRPSAFTRPEGKGGAAVVSTLSDLVAAYLDSSAGARTRSSGAEASSPVLSVIAALWEQGGPLARIASAKRNLLTARGENGWFAQNLSTVAFELSQQLLPGVKDGRRPAVAAALHVPRLNEGARGMGLTVGKSPASGQKMVWGERLAWFEQSALCELACDPSCDCLVECLQQLSVLATPPPPPAKAGSTASASAASDAATSPTSSAAWLATWKPRVAATHAHLRATHVLVDTNTSAYWVCRPSAAPRPRASGAFDDAALLFVSMFVECLATVDSEYGQRFVAAEEADLHAAIDALVPTAGGAALWEPRFPGVGASPFVRRAVALCGPLLVHAARHAIDVSGANEPGALHPCNWLLPLLSSALRMLRSPTLSNVRKRLAWYIARRAATALNAELPLPAPSPDAMPAIVRQLRARAPTADTRLNLGCCQPLALRGDVAAGEAARVAYVDSEGALLTTTGGRFGQDFDEILGSFRYDDLAAAHFRALVAPTTFEDVSEYDSAFSAVASHFSHLHPVFLRLKGKLGELAPLLFASASAKADQLAAGVTSELLELLQGEKEEDLARVCDGLRATVGTTRQWAALKNGKGGATPKLKLEATEKLVAGLSACAHELAIAKSRQGDVLSARYRVPRYDCGQRLTYLDRSGAAPGWRDVTVVHGGALLAEVDADGKVLVWGERAEAQTGRSASGAKGCADWVDALLTGTDDMLEHAREVMRRVLARETKEPPL